MIYLVGLIIVILLFGSAAVMNAAGFILGIIALVGFLVWLSVETGLDPGLLIIVILGGIVALAVLGYSVLLILSKREAEQMKRDLEDRLEKQKRHEAFLEAEALREIAMKNSSRTTKHWTDSSW